MDRLGNRLLTTREKGLLTIRSLFPLPRRWPFRLNQSGQAPAPDLYFAMSPCEQEWCVSQETVPQPCAKIPGSAVSDGDPPEVKVVSQA